VSTAGFVGTSLIAFAAASGSFRKITSYRYSAGLEPNPFGARSTIARICVRLRTTTVGT
jgi:hypothetical protein